VSRNISATNLAEINASHLHPVTLVKIEFDEPVYAHSGIGTITFDGNDYIGVGKLGQIDGSKESEALRPTSLRITLSGIDDTRIAEALRSGNYGDKVTIYEGYRQDDGTLVDDPIIVWKGKHEHSGVIAGDESSVSLTVQHDLAILDEKDGSRFSDEDQQRRYPSDNAFQFVHSMATIKLLWGDVNAYGGVTSSSANGSGSGSRRVFLRN
jgi:hypothetical protein